MNGVVSKEDVERLLGFGITDKHFNAALEYAKRKQEYIFNMERSPVVWQDWYLVKLAEEYARSTAFSLFTMELYRTLLDMEKEHPVKNRSAPMDNHIVAVSVE